MSNIIVVLDRFLYLYVDTLCEEQQLIQTLPDLEDDRKISSSIQMLIVNTATPDN